MARRSMRAEIVEAALEQFHVHGYNAAGVQTITDAAGVPKGSFYNHFDSKESLAVVALRRYGESHSLEAVIGPDGEPLARLRAHFEFLRDQTVRHGYARGCMFGNFGAEIGDHSEMIREVVGESLRQWAGSIAEVIAEAQRAGAVRAGLDPGSAARFLLDAWEGTLIRARADRSPSAFDTFFDIVFGTLLVA
jgi:TetR/AcrR family transcriptional repressor of nem operon